MENLGSYVHNIDQNVQNHTRTISNVPVINLAFRTNIRSTKGTTFPESGIDLNPYFLHFSDFMQLFFRGYGGAFHINPSCMTHKAVSLSEQTYSTIHDSNVIYSLKDQIIKAYEKAYNKSSLGVSPLARIAFDREMFLARSLLCFNGTQVGLSFDECLHALLQSNEIAKADLDSSAKVNFIITLQYVSDELSVACNCNFKFQTNIPGYVNNNVLSGMDLPKTYSNDLKHLSSKKDSHDFGDDFSIEEDKSVSSHDDNTIITSNSLNTGLVKEVSNLILSGASVSNSTIW
jgi:hypothetical protein